MSRLPSARGEEPTLLGCSGTGNREQERGTERTGGNSHQEELGSAHRRATDSQRRPRGSWGASCEAGTRAAEAVPGARTRHTHTHTVQVSHLANPSRGAVRLQETKTCLPLSHREQLIPHPPHSPPQHPGLVLQRRAAGQPARGREGACGAPRLALLFSSLPRHGSVSSSQLCPVELSVMMKVFYIHAVQHSSQWPHGALEHCTVAGATEELNLYSIQYLFMLSSRIGSWLLNWLAQP